MTDEDKETIQAMLDGFVRRIEEQIAASERRTQERITASERSIQEATVANISELRTEMLDRMDKFDRRLDRMVDELSHLTALYRTVSR